MSDVSKLALRVAQLERELRGMTERAVHAERIGVGWEKRAEKAEAEVARLREALGDVGEWYAHDFDDRPYDLGKAIRETWPGLLAERVTCGACGGEGEIGDSVCSTCSGRGGVLVSPSLPAGAQPSNIEKLSKLLDEGGFMVTVDPDGVAASFDSDCGTCRAQVAAGIEPTHDPKPSQTKACESCLGSGEAWYDEDDFSEIVSCPSCGGTGES